MCCSWNVRKSPFLAWSVISALGFLAVSPAVADMVDYHDYVQGLSQTLAQYDFDGATDAERLEDKKGTNDLTQSGTVTYRVAGYDATSEAFTPGITPIGTLLTSSSIILPPSGATCEMVFRPDDISGTAGYIVAAYDLSNRSYLALTQSGNLTARAGTGSFSAGAYSTDHWYYMATTMSYDSGSNTTAVTVYLADLSSETPTLAAHSGTMPGTFSIDLPYGIGALWYNSAPQWSFHGDIDEVTFYSGVMGEAFLQKNLNRIANIPEPSSVLLALLGVCGFGMVVRRYR